MRRALPPCMPQRMHTSPPSGASACPDRLSARCLRECWSNCSKVAFGSTRSVLPSLPSPYCLPAATSWTSRQARRSRGCTAGGPGTSGSTAPFTSAWGGRRVPPHRATWGRRRAARRVLAAAGPRLAAAPALCQHPAHPQNPSPTLPQVLHRPQASAGAERRRCGLCRGAGGGGRAGGGSRAAGPGSAARRHQCRVRPAAAGARGSQRRRRQQRGRLDSV